jgi:hypothetical protein
MSSEGGRGATVGGRVEAESGAGQATPRPTHIYINHLLANEDADIHAYLFPLAGSQSVQEAVKNAIPDIRAGRHRVPGSPNSVEWRHYSYIAFILEDPDTRLESIDFKIDGNGANLTFDEETPLDDFDDFTGVYYLNARRSRDGDPLRRDEREYYRWHADHPHNKAGSGSPESHENSGTNVGP